MSQTLKLKRGAKTDLPTLNLGELGYCTDTKELFIGNGIGNTLLNSMSSISGTGILSINGSAEINPRTIQEGSGINITNGSGVSGDPSIAVDFGSSAGTVCQGNDSRLSDARTPTSHDNTYHSVVYITASGVTFTNLNANDSVKNENDMLSNSSVHVPTQSSVKAYVDTSVSIIDGGELP